MNMNLPLHPPASMLFLLFSCERCGHINDLRRGIRVFLTQFYPFEVAMRMTMAPTYNWIFSKDRSERCIMLTSEFPSMADPVLIDLYARLQQRQSVIRTSMSTYEVALDGTLDHQRINAVCLHYFWINSFFDPGPTLGSERHLLN